ncbi:MAG: sulfide/dihydroorotate dehydrogenase-like FAD/NAD-binding protein, partial [Armatimonadetes bacterium]|nr:sulfide/dihydroorotate dehydrogenase-like FAD/NAD-binding protein [Armatimonadota bacterium]
MFRVTAKRELAPNIYELKIAAPEIARNREVGQFLVVRVHEGGERIPLSIIDVDPDAGTVTIVVQVAGHSTKELCSLEVGDAVRDVLGPLGHPTEIRKFGTACYVGGGVGVPVGYPMTKALKEAGNYVITIIGFRTKDLVIYENELRAISDELVVTTDDGTYGRHALVTEPLRKMLEAGRKIDFVITVGPVPMMEAVAEVTRPYGIKTVASLNPIMVDATGMCGACRVSVGGEVKFACVDGPEFDAHLVDFRELRARLRAFDPDPSLQGR